MSWLLFRQQRYGRPHRMPIPQNAQCPALGRGIALVLSQGVLAERSVTADWRCSAATGIAEGNAAEHASGPADAKRLMKFPLKSNTST
jgi:hypothetical protein